MHRWYSRCDNTPNIQKKSIIQHSHNITKLGHEYDLLLITTTQRLSLLGIVSFVMYLHTPPLALQPILLD